ncbi:metal-dependent hydrolase [Planococcus salinus]|uniref:Metal-dependent hydrolase n=1 Tax=Planococcus salinus TaxID=1848460 RepID=A0A3M8P8Z8_9BACL|nr:metal-dependent hydrolase [Planococcus salinus]RNF40175.1 metal-dependent hydrolase [Planococcus salinus]
MTGKTHITGGIAASLAFAQITDYDPAILLLTGVVGSLLPDICHGGSKMGRTFPLLSKTINMIFGHRTFTHSLLFLFLVNLLLQTFITNDSVIAGLMVGMASHLLLDMVTKNGIKLFFPWKLTVRSPITATTGGHAEYAVFAVLSLLSVYFGYDVFMSYLAGARH